MQALYYAGNQSAAAAVMVFIDGANGFTEGGWDISTQKGMVRNLVTRGVVVVTLQYRLGALGGFWPSSLSLWSPISLKSVGRLEKLEQNE
ncbi:unnamed protein product [Heligmosomoides polygyrus]|uniref:COesterase domain-containing protein n=1 Tax=Heligmosomoides polygyrus TaxID=6339 RepID=A0A183G5N4_HELPZ|nr:unnamed protein product [Heligmosomoides polygyrus]